MTITLNEASKARALYSTLDSITHAVDAGSGSNRLLVAIVIQRGTLRTISAITYNSTAMSLAVAQDVTGQQLRTSIYYLVAPSTGSNNLEITYVGTQGQTEIMACVFDGVDQSGPLDDSAGAEGSSNSPSVSITPTTDGQVIVAGVLHEASTAGTVGSGETSLWDTDQGAWATSGSYAIQTTAASQAMDWSFGVSDVWTAAAASFKAASGGAVTGAGTLAGAGAAEGAALNVVPAGASLAGAGGALAASLLNIPAQANALGSGQLLGTGELLGMVLGAAQLAGAGELDAAAFLIVPGSGNLTSSVSLAGAAILIVSGLGDLAGAGELIGDGVNLGQAVVGAALLSGVGGLSGSPALSVLGTAVLTGLAGVQATAVLTVMGAGQASGAGMASGTAELVIRAIAQLIGSGALHANGRIVGLMLILPDGRTFVAEFDVRAYAVPAEDRTFVVEAEDRVYTPA